VKVIDVRERFLEAMKGLEDAEEKRRMFRATFYQVLSETAKEDNCNTLIQGTIRADIDETVGGVKTQHNVLQQMGINPMERFGFKIIEPLVSLYKGQVRMVARFLGLPSEFSERQPFPGPGLSVRVVGQVRPDKLETVKRATAIVEDELSRYTPSQYFAVIFDQKELSRQSSIDAICPIVAQILDTPQRYIKVRVFKDKATGVKEGERQYGQILGIKASTMNGRVRSIPIKSLTSLQDKIITENPTVARCFYAIKELEEKSYVIGIRAVETENFLTAQVSEIPWTALDKTAELVLEKCPNVSAVYYDITPKPPATIEME
jgi:GMP synthase (glutamine-hydrolysing)